MSRVPPSSPRYALLSVSDKQGLLPVARALLTSGYTLLSTGGTASILREAGLQVTDVASITGSPELLGGRVKTLHPHIHAALLARRDDPTHLEELAAHDIPLIDVLVVNLYPFAHTIASPEVTLAQAIAQIDIGGPTMLRAAAKNFAHVLPICSPDDYAWLIAALERGEPFDSSTRRALATKAFAHTAAYDSTIARYMSADKEPGEQPLPELLDLSLHKTMDLRYGENPHQHAALYHSPPQTPLHGTRKLHGKALSYNNIVDLDAALALVQEFSTPSVAIIKHTNPAGCACHPDDLSTAYARALQSDPVSAFGGIVALNRHVDEACARAMHDHFFEVIAAPGFGDEALAILTRKKNVRLLQIPDTFFGASTPAPSLQTRATSLGLLVQQADPRISIDLSRCQIPTERAPSDSELQALAFAWRVCKHVKSNAIVLATHEVTLGVGAGQMSRVDAVRLAISRARSPLQGAVLASDAFFPFPDGPELAIEAGITAIVQPGGSIRDQQVIDVCDAHDIAMLFTGERHFRH